MLAVLRLMISRVRARAKLRENSVALVGDSPLSRAPTRACTASFVPPRADDRSIALLDRFVAAGCPFDTDAHGRTALHHAASGTSAPAEMLRELVRRGLDLEARDQHGATPLKLCAKDLHTSAFDTLVALGARSTDEGDREAAIADREWFESKF